jgi:hypothetical protein
MLVPEADAGILRKFPSEYRRVPEPPVALPKSGPPIVVRNTTPTEKDSPDAVVQEIVRLVSQAVREPTPIQFRSTAARNLPDFATLLDVHLMLRERHSSSPEEDPRAVLEFVGTWGGDHRVDEVEHAMMLMQRSGIVIARFMHQPAPPEQEDDDIRLAQRWMFCRAGYVFHLLGALEICASELLSTHQVADAVFEDLVAYAREACNVARKAYSLRHPETDAD